VSWFSKRIPRSRQPHRDFVPGGRRPRIEPPDGAASAQSAGSGAPDPAAELFELGRRFETRFGQTGNAEDLDQAIAALRKAVDATPRGHPQRASRLTVLGNALRTRFDRRGRPVDLQAALAAVEEAVAISAGDPDRGRHLSSLAVALRTRSQRGGNRRDLDRAIGLGDEAVTSMAEDHPDRPKILTDLASSLLTRFKQSGSLADLDRAIAAARDVVAIAAENGIYQANLGVMLRMRYEVTGDLRSLRDAVTALRSARKVISADDPSTPGVLTTLGVALKTMFDRTSDLQLLDEAIAVHRAAAATATNASFPRRNVLNNLTGALWARYISTGKLDDLEDAIKVGRQARGANLIVALNTRFARTRNPADLDEAIALAREIVASDPVGLPARALHLGMLGQALLNQFHRTGELAVLEEAISVDRQALDATPAAHPDHPIRLENLGGALEDQFIRTGDQSCLDEAIQVLRDALRLTPAGHDMIPSLHSSLAWVLMARFRSTGDTASLEDAVQASREAVALTPADHTERPGRLASLGSALHALSRRLVRLNDLEEAIAVLREADQALPEGHRKRPGIQGMLGSALSTLYDQTRDVTALDEALAVQRDAFAHTPCDDPRRGGSFHNVAVVLWRRYRRTGSRHDFSEALRTCRQALEARPADDPHRAVDMSLLGTMFWDQYRRTKARRHVADMLNASREAAQSDTAPIVTRVGAASNWGLAAATLKNWEQAVEAFTTATSLLPLRAGMELDRRDQEHHLGDETDLAADGAASALNLGRPELAVGMLEQGRGVLFSQALEGRSDLTELRQHHPGIADELLRLNWQLDTPVAPDLGGLPEPPDSGTAATGHQEVHDRHRLSRERKSLIEKIRDLPGFERFLLPPQEDQLLAAASQGPVICCNVSSYRSDALIVCTDGIRIVNLPEVTPERVRDNVAKLLTASSEAGRASGEALLQAQRPLDEVLQWLWDALAQPVLASLGLSATPSSGQPWPRVWWVPTGLLTFLPLHAAGYHTWPSDRTPQAIPMTVLDRVVSSYAPTIRALLHARERAISTSAPRKALIVTMPTTPGQSDLPDLPGADKEANIIQACVPGSLTLRAENATAKRIITEMPAYPWVHFACHAESDVEDPSLSQLVVHNHEQRTLTVLDIARLQTDRAELAFLSACETARTGRRIADEAIHLASAFQLAGYPQVVGTLWPIKDYAAVRISAFFYHRIGQQGSSNTQSYDFATALHETVQRIRDEHRSMPSLWASHIHVGS
jgi:tetratricopeptide (TPR) repeat protein